MSVTPINSALARPGAEATSARYGYTLSLLTVLYVLNIVDRQIVTILAEPIKAEFSLSDSQVGLMTGLSFAIIYTVAGFPLARWAERGNRVHIIGLSVFVWSAFTAVCGLAQNFLQFLVARVGVGIGEAGCTPPAQSLITDIAPREKRATALAIYSLGAPIGQFAGMAIGGVIASIWGWRAAFLIVGLPGLLFALLALRTLPEPRRMIRRGDPDADAETPPPFWPTMKTLLRNRGYLLLAVGQGGIAFITYGLGAFLGSFFLRNHGPEVAGLAEYFGLEALGFLGIALGIVAGTGGVIGGIAGGRIADRWARRDIAAYALLPAICVACGAFLMIAAMTLPGFQPSIICVGLAFAANVACIGVCHAGTLGLAHLRSRATAAALNLFIVNMIGLGLGPLSVGILSDILSANMGLGGGEGLRWAMVAACLAGFASAALFWSARNYLRTGTIS